MTRKGILLAAVLIPLAAILVVLIGYHREPVYGGRPLSYWTGQLNSPSGARQVIKNPVPGAPQIHPLSLETSEAIKAVKALGTNAVPDLIRTLHSKDWPHRAAVVRWVSSHQLTASMLKFGPSAAAKQRDALTALRFIGPAAKAAAPEVMPFLTNDLGTIRREAYYTFAALAPDAQSVVTAIPILTNDAAFPGSDTQLQAIAALGAIVPPPPEALPALLQALGDAREFVRYAAVKALQAFKPMPPTAVELLCLDLNDSDRLVCDAAWDALRSNLLAIPALERGLTNNDPAVVCNAAIRIGTFGTNAAAAAPRLRELCGDSMLTVRDAASNALVAVTGEKPASSARAARLGANIAYNFPAIPVAMLIDVYEGLVKKTVAAPQDGWPNATIRLRTPYDVTAEEAAQLIEETLKREAHVTIRHEADGALRAVVDSSYTGPRSSVVSGGAPRMPMPRMVPRRAAAQPTGAPTP